ncbi:MAG TPA: amino acid permease [Gemmatimonadaceae bacterium]|nr:amino acid permease [Gemmatimonadaceae bacterium]
MTSPSLGSWVRGLSLLGAVALVVGNMVGTSVYTLPALLARETGPLGILAWVVTAAGYLFVALVYASLGRRYPETSGPYVFAREALGEFAGFQSVWAYWFSAVIGNAAIVTGVVGYIEGFSSTLAGSELYRFLLAQGLLWGLCVVNVLGIRLSARIQISVLFLNVVPLLLFSIIALFYFDAANLAPFAPRGWGSLVTGVALIVWAYSGIESATVPAEEIRGSPQTISRATMLGYAVGTAAFLLAATAVAGVIPNAELATSARPIALAAERTIGPWAGTIIAFAAIVAGLGTLNGWILMAGRIPVSAARDGIFFSGLGRLHPRFGTPHVSLIVATLIGSLALGLYFTKTTLGVFDTIVQLSVLTTLLPHLYTAAAEWMLRRKGELPSTMGGLGGSRFIAPVAFAFVLWSMYGIAPSITRWAFLVILAGIPLYIWFKTRR